MDEKGKLKRRKKAKGHIKSSISSRKLHSESFLKLPKWEDYPSIMHQSFESSTNGNALDSETENASLLSSDDNPAFEKGMNTHFERKRKNQCAKALCLTKSEGSPLEAIVKKISKKDEPPRPGYLHQKTKNSSKTHCVKQSLLDIHTEFDFIRQNLTVSSISSTTPLAIKDDSSNKENTNNNSHMLDTDKENREFILKQSNAKMPSMQCNNAKLHSKKLGIQCSEMDNQQVVGNCSCNYYASTCNKATMIDPQFLNNGMRVLKNDSILDASTAEQTEIAYGNDAPLISELLAKHKIVEERSDASRLHILQLQDKIDDNSQTQGDAKRCSCNKSEEIETADGKDLFDEQNTKADVLLHALPYMKWMVEQIYRVLDSNVFRIGNQLDCNIVGHLPFEVQDQARLLLSKNGTPSMELNEHTDLTWESTFLRLGLTSFSFEFKPDISTINTNHELMTFTALERSFLYLINSLLFVVHKKDTVYGDIFRLISDYYKAYHEKSLAKFEQTNTVKIEKYIENLKLEKENMQAEMEEEHKKLVEKIASLERNLIKETERNSSLSEIIDKNEKTNKNEVDYIVYKMEQEHEQKVSELKLSWEKQTLQLREETSNNSISENRVATLESNHHAAMEQLKSKYTSTITDMSAQHSEEIEFIKSKQQKALLLIKEKTKQLSEEHQQHIMDLRQDYAIKSKQLVAQAKEEMSKEFRNVILPKELCIVEKELSKKYECNTAELLQKIRILEKEVDSYKNSNEINILKDEIDPSGYDFLADVHGSIVEEVNDKETSVNTFSGERISFQSASASDEANETRSSVVEMDKEESPRPSSALPSPQRLSISSVSDEISINSVHKSYHDLLTEYIRNSS